MKIAHFELLVEVENALEKKLFTLFGQEYSLLINPEGNSLTLLVENGEIDYHCIEIYKNGEKYSTKQNEDEFWSIIHLLEQDQKVNELYAEIETALRESSPHLFEEDLDFPKTYSIYMKYIVPIALITTIGVGLLLLSLF